MNKNQRFESKKPELKGLSLQDRLYIPSQYSTVDGTAELNSKPDAREPIENDLEKRYKKALVKRHMKRVAKHNKELGSLYNKPHISAASKFIAKKAESSSKLQFKNTRLAGDVSKQLKKPEIPVKHKENCIHIKVDLSTLKMTILNKTRNPPSSPRSVNSSTYPMPSLIHK